MAAEWICNSLGEMAGLPVPNFRVAEDLYGNYVFASQIFGSLDQNAKTQAEQLRFLSSTAPSQVMLEQISKIYTFDLFSHNGDRHINNFAFRKQNGQDRIIVIDFDRSFFLTGLCQIYPSISIATLFKRAD